MRPAIDFEPNIACFKLFRKNGAVYGRPGAFPCYRKVLWHSSLYHPNAP